MSLTASRLTLNLNDYRGLSAYEIAIQNGFVGSEQEWLASLKGERGEDGDLVTVNGKRSVAGNISVNATDIYMYPGMQDETVAQKLEALAENVVDSLTVQSAVQALSANQGYQLNQKKAEATGISVSLPVSGWASSGEGYAQTVSVTGVTERNLLVVTPFHASMDEYAECGIRATTQAANNLTFFAVDLPESDFTVNVMIINPQGVSA